MKPIHELAINTIRTLAIDAVEKANSGHPGTPMGSRRWRTCCVAASPEARPARPALARSRPLRALGRPRLMLLYSLLHLRATTCRSTELKQLPPVGSAHAGPSRVRPHAPGVEATTGPLGQGIGNAVGMAIAERILAARFNRPGHEIVDHRTYAIVLRRRPDGGRLGEAASLAGHLALGKLIALYDDNHITLDGDTALAFTEDVGGALRGLRLARAARRRHLDARRRCATALDAAARRRPRGRR